MIFPNKPQIITAPLLLSLRFRSSPCSALKTVETNYYCTDISAFQHDDGFKKILRRIHRPNWTSNIIDLDLDRKERLKWYSEMLRNCVLNWSLNEGKAIHGEVIKSGIDPDSHLWVSLINFYAKCRNLDFARRVFDEMPDQDVVSWTALIAGFVAEGYSCDGLGLLCEMQKEGVRPNEFTLATVLKACSMCLGKGFGKQLHAEVVKIGFFSDIYVGSALVDLYAKCGEMEYADKVFFFMPEQNAVSWNALLNGYAQVGDGEEVLRLFCRMKETEMMLNKFTLSTVLKGCANSGHLGTGQLVHSMAIKIGCEHDEFVSCSLVYMYSKCGMADDAFNVFFRIKHPDIVTWSAMICCLDQQGRKREAVELFHSMKHMGLRPNQFTLASLVNAATDLGDPHYCESIHALICKYGYESDNFVSSALITLYIKIGSVQKGWQVFKAINQHVTASWNALLAGFEDREASDLGPRIFHEMLVEGFKPDVYTFVSILGCCSSLSDNFFGKQVHTHIVKNGLDSKTSIATSLINMYAKSWCCDDADAIFNRLQERDLFAYTAIIGNYAQTNQGEKAFKCLSQMQREGVKPNKFTLSSCLSVCANLATLENGQQLHSLAMKVGVLGNTFVAISLVDMYSKCRCIEYSEAVFSNIFERNTIAWNTIISGYSQHGKGEKALEAFQLMLCEGILPDEVTFIGVLSACSHMGLIEEGKKHFNLMRTVYGISPTIEHHACMVNILCRAGKFCDVECFIEQMELTSNAFIWEIVLWACKIHGNVEFGQKTAEKLFGLEHGTDYNYVLLSNIFAAEEKWDDVAKVRALMCSQGIKKEPGCSWVEIDARAHMFFAQDGSLPEVRNICQQLGEMTR